MDDEPLPDAEEEEKTNTGDKPNAVTDFDKDIYDDPDFQNFLKKYRVK